MATQQLIDIIIKATDQASATAKKVDEKLKKVYSDVEKANSKAAKSSQKFNTELIRTGESFQVVGGGAAQAANLLGQMKLDPKFGSTMDRAKLKVSEMGYDITSLGGRLRVLGTAGSTVWNSFKARVTSAATTMKGKLGAAVDSVRTKLKSLSVGAKGIGGIFGGLKGVLSMTAGMIGYDLVTGIVQAARASINAASQVEYFGQRLNKMTGETHLSTEKFQEFKGQLGDLQKEFRKVDMTAVGATAEELAVKMNLPANKLKDLTRMTAVMSSTFVKEGRSQEDAVLAVSDALDGQFKRLQEIGISQQMLIDNGWSGDIEDQTTLIDALNKTMADMGYEQTAKDITNLDEAWNALTISGGQLMQKVLVPLTPVIIKIIEGLMKFADVVSGAVSAIGSLPDWAKLAIGAGAFALAIAGVATAMDLGLIPSIGVLTGELSAAALAALDFALAMLANPLTWVALAIAGIVVAVYELGKAFGWWTDVNSMLSAIWAGIQRLWSAFINHPDVVALINAIKAAWAALQPYIRQVISYVLSFFQTSGNKNFDIVRALIVSLGQTWKQMTMPIRLVINVVKLLINWFKTTYAQGKANIEKIKALFRALPGAIRSAISTLVNIITTPFRNAYNGVKGAVDRIKNAAKGITNISLSSITNKITQPFANAYNKVVSWVNKIKAKANSLTGGALGFLGFGFDYEGMMEEMNSKPVVATASDEIKINHDINFLFDFNNLPAGIDEDDLKYMLQSAITDKSVINSLVNNPDFQSLDQKVKQRITLKNNRARGV